MNQEQEAPVKEKKSKNDEPNLELQLLQEKLKNLEAKVVKPKTDEELFQERIAKYDAGAPARAKLVKEIDERRMKMWQENPKARRDEIIQLEAWDRRAEQLKTVNPQHSAQLKARASFKRKEIEKDQSR